MQHFSPILLLTFIWFGCDSTWVSGQDGTKPVELPRFAEAQIKKLVAAECERQSIPGISVAISSKEYTQSNSIGQADIENSVPVSSASLFRTASVAKTLTAVLCMKLHELGKLDLDAPVQQYVSEYPTKQWPITSRQLLGHLAGVRHYRNNQEASAKTHYTSLTDALSVFANDPLEHEPGSKYHYSSFGYNLLGLVAERAGKASFMTLLRQHVLEPAELKHTFEDQHFQLFPHRVRGYRLLKVEQLKALGIQDASSSQITNAELHDTSMKIPGGGLLSTAEDLAKFGEALMEGKLLSKETVELMWTEQKTSSDKPTGYGLGWRIGEVGGRKAVWHSGGQAGTSTYLLLIPDRGVSVGLMCNLQSAALGNLANEIARAAP